MMKIGITRPVDNLGRIVLPVELRKLYCIEKNDVVEMLGTDEGILIRIPGVEIIRKQEVNCQGDKNG
ncbi:MAG: AbrB/MazE/SpoVT family DNA-binding domain-containing protein [Clostridia bacterium]|nr:AbrB/MazE/SpoVT family DNA-binding domain-containing protein [Clostridia bacterium]MBQ2420742.1 AbrB/MazE/SpoVT family DNA-binding domain-containing protein [Clostridia bacterium]MBQ5597114.1 AbrB/MazE/SpoVT family DNA-binding domain-containing protein [Clostridia bacterium]